MRPCLAAVGLLAVLTAPLGADDRKPAEEPGEKLTPVGRLIGTLREGGTGGGWILHFKVPVIEPNLQAQANYLRQLQALLVRQQVALRNPNPWQRQQQMLDVLRDAQNLARQQKDLYTVRESEHDLALELADSVKVRSSQPAEVFDAKGNIKRFTAQELRELRGPENLPGFPAEVSALQAGQTVVVTLARKPLPRELRTEEPPMPGKKPVPKPQPQFKLVVTLVLIGSEAR